MKKKNNNLVTRPVLQQELKKLEKKLEKKISGLDKSILSYKGEIDFKVDDYFQKTEVAIKQSASRILGVVSEAMGELNTVRDTQEIVGQRTYENVDKLEDHEIRIKNLEQKVAIAL